MSNYLNISVKIFSISYSHLIKSYKHKYTHLNCQTLIVVQFPCMKHNCIREGLIQYADQKRTSEWLNKQRYNSAEVKQLFG